MLYPWKRLFVLCSKSKALTLSPIHSFRRRPSFRHILHCGSISDSITAYHIIQTPIVSGIGRITQSVYLVSCQEDRVPDVVKSRSLHFLLRYCWTQTFRNYSLYEYFLYGRAFCHFLLRWFTVASLRVAVRCVDNVELRLIYILHNS